ncbi:UNVERIFIED_CONTAM: hypothetical protein NCL1_07668 [Trichonephila clavipes]
MSHKNEKEENRLINSNLIKFIPQIYPHSEKFGTVIEDDDDTNVDSENALSTYTTIQRIAKHQNNLPGSKLG